MKLPGNMGNMQQMMRQAQQMQEKLHQEIALIKVEATAGGGMVTVQMDGQKNMLAVKIELKKPGQEPKEDKPKDNTPPTTTEPEEEKPSLPSEP